MTTEELAKLIEGRVINNRNKRLRVYAIEYWELQSELEKAIRDLNLVQSEPVPEDAVPTVKAKAVKP